jgi:16S rRNA (cytidine1402-2'-O)-methyltransferase
VPHLHHPPAVGGLADTAQDRQCEDEVVTGEADNSVPGGRLVLAATPIGDVGDASPRLAALIAEADVVAAEDTRRLRRLASALGVTPSGRVLSYQEHNEATRTEQLVEAVRGGSTVVLVTDAGTPAVSDPGLRAVRAVAEAGLPVSAIPGPSAVLTALTLSGLATDRFCFEGFLPRRNGDRRRALAALAGETRTMVFFEAPHRLDDALAAMVDAFGADRPAALARELTKTHEEVRREPLGALAAWAAEAAPKGEILGELTVVVAGRRSDAGAAPGDLQALVDAVLARVDAGERLSDAAPAVAAGTGVTRRELYAAAAAARSKGPVPVVDPSPRPTPAEVERLYLDAFSPPPMNEGPKQAAGIAAWYAVAVRRPDLTVVTAHDRGALVGLCFGHPWWWDEMDDEWSRALGSRMGKAAPTLDGMFGVGVLAVRPDRQSAGLGTALLRAAVARSGLRRAWLVTRDDETPALRLYRALGWTTVGHGPDLSNGRAALVLASPERWPAG